MLKNIKLILLVMVSVVLLQSCKSPEPGFKWFLFEAEGSYSADNNTSYIKLNAWVEIEQSSVNINPANITDPTYFQTASVVNWSYRIFSGETLILEVNNYNIENQFGDIHLNVAEDQLDYLWVAILSEIPLSGDIFNGMTPDSVEFEMGIYADNGSAYLVSKIVPFIFSRN